MATVIVPLALFTLYRGWTSQLPKHKKIAKITLPIWLYVSVTGVLIYGMLYL
jgi:putative membrane protein